MQRKITNSPPSKPLTPNTPTPKPPTPNPPTPNPPTPNPPVPNPPTPNPPTPNPPVYTVPKDDLTVPITADELSVARVTDTLGNPQAQASAALSRPHLLFKIQEQDASFTKEQLEAASWQVTLTGSSGLDIKIGAPVSVTSRIEFDCPVQNYTVTPTVYLTFKDGSNQTKVAKLTVASPLSIAGQAEFGQKKYIDLRPDSPTLNAISDIPMPDYTELNLDTADDFNYHFNGLNYPDYATYKAARASDSSDKEAQALFRLWVPEADPDAPTVRHSASWDIRGCETKNSTLLIKTLQRDNNSIFLAKDGEKKYSGFTDLYSGPNAGDSPAGSHKMINGSICSEKHSKQYGYFEAKVRLHNLQEGHWAAFWVYGDHYEYDIMECGAHNNGWFDQTTHWHNGWSKPNYRGSLHNWSKPSASSTDTKELTDSFFTLGLYWDNTRFVYYVNGKKTHEVMGDTANKLKATYKRYDNGSRTGGVAEGSFTVMQQPRDEGGTGGQSISDDFMRTYFSTEVLYRGWMGDLGIGNEGKMPSWMEVEYYTYYKK